MLTSGAGDTKDYQGVSYGPQGCELHFTRDHNCGLKNIEIISPKPSIDSVRLDCGYLVDFDLDITTVCNFTTMQDYFFFGSGSSMGVRAYTACFVESSFSMSTATHTSIPLSTVSFDLSWTLLRYAIDHQYYSTTFMDLFFFYSQHCALVTI